MKRRLLVARALIHEPRVLLLDEPTTGLDPQARHMVWDQLIELKKRGITLMLCTHYMDEAAYLCDRLIILDRGRVLTEGKPDDLVRQHVGSQVVEVQPRDGQQRTLTDMLRQRGVEYQEGIKGIFIFSRDGYVLDASLREMAERVTYRSANLEDVYLRLTGRGLREEE
jgi:lipooligosaccharide transport system ATP-binding protein